jgi:hypothetical protein
MSTELLPVAASHMPKAWREAISKARENGLHETVVQLIAEAAARRMIDANGWHQAHASVAIDLLEPLPRSATRLRRLRGLLSRIVRAERDAEDIKREETARVNLLALNRTLTWRDAANLSSRTLKRDCEVLLNSMPELERRDMGGVKCWIRRKTV